MKLFPGSAGIQLELDKIKALLVAHCQTAYAIKKAEDLVVYDRKEPVGTALKQSQEYSNLIQQVVYFPNDYVLNLEQELKLLSIPGAVLNGEQFLLVRRLAESAEKIFRWFDAERKLVYSALLQLINDTYYEKSIKELIDHVLDDDGQVKDNASPELKTIRMELYRKRNELRRLFDIPV